MRSCGWCFDGKAATRRGWGKGATNPFERLSLCWKKPKKREDCLSWKIAQRFSGEFRSAGFFQHRSARGEEPLAPAPPRCRLGLEQLLHPESILPIFVISSFAAKDLVAELLVQANGHVIAGGYFQTH